MNAEHIEVGDTVRWVQFPLSGRHRTGVVTEIGIGIAWVQPHRKGLLARQIELSRLEKIEGKSNER
jgi:hypothetical protein